MDFVRIFFSAALFTFITSYHSNAQLLGVKHYSNDTRMDAGLSVGMPMGYLFKTAVDAELRYQKDLTSRIAGLANIGFSYYLGNGATLKNNAVQNAGFLPVKTGAKVFLNERVYLSGEIGAAFKTTDIMAPSLIYSPGLGFEFDKGLDLALRYERFTKYDASKIALKVAYGLHFKKHAKYSSWYN